MVYDTAQQTQKFSTAVPLLCAPSNSSDGTINFKGRLLHCGKQIPASQTSFVGVFLVSCRTSGTHTAAPKQTCPAPFCRTGRPSRTSRSTAHRCPTPPKASTSTSRIPTTCTRSPGPSTRADVSADATVGAPLANMPFLC